MQLHAIGHGVRNVLSIFLVEYYKFTQRSPLALSPRQGRALVPKVKYNLT
jgi:hypothetical protein